MNPLPIEIIYSSTGMIMINTTIPTLYQGMFYPYNVEWLELDDLELMTGDALTAWRPNLKQKLNWVFGNLRPRTCLVCGKPFGVFDMHEAVLSRNDVRGWKKTKKLLIMSELNCLPLHHSPCHMDYPPSREEAWKYQEEFYGRKLLEQWYESLPFKDGPPRLF